MGKGLDVGGYEERPDWPKLGPSLLIATCLMLAIRTARWPAVRRRALAVLSSSRRSNTAFTSRDEFFRRF